MGESLEPMPLEEYGIEIVPEDNRPAAVIEADCADGFNDALAEAVTDAGLEALQQKVREGELNLEDPENPDAASDAADAIQREAKIRGFDGCDDSQRPLPAPNGMGIPMS